MNLVDITTKPNSVKLENHISEDTGLERTVSDFQPKHMGYYIKPSPKYLSDAIPIAQVDTLDLVGKHFLIDQ